MPGRTLIVASLTCLWILGGGTSLAGAEARFTARLADGTRLSGSEPAPWHDSAASPRLGDRPLFDPENPARWIRDNSLPPPETPAAFIELWGGDRLPGRVVGSRTGSESPPRQLPPCLLVEPTVPLDWPDGSRRESIPVLTRWVRRIAWKWRGSHRSQPSTLFFLDGRRLKFRSVRFEGGSARLLLEEGTTEVPFTQISELHLPPRDPWEAHFEALAALTPGGAGRLLEIETRGGLRVTASTGRFLALSRGDPEDPQSWYQEVQPVWSLEPFWLEHRSIRLRRYFRPEEVPLSRLEPSRIRQDSPLSSSWTPRVDRSVQGGPLASGGLEYGWGLGVQARSELAFELPRAARSFRSLLGLDQAAGRGGSARGVVFAGGPAYAERAGPLFRSKLLIGSAEVVETGLITFPPARAGRRELVLLADPVLEDLPPGADPLDIRDTLDWLEPELSLDGREVRDEIRRAAPRWIPAFEGWTIEGSDEPLELVNRWDGDGPPASRPRLEVVPLLRYLKLRRSVKVGEGERSLVLAVGAAPGVSPPPRLHVRIDGRSDLELEVGRRRGGADPAPLRIPLERWRGRTVAIEIYQLQGGREASVEWQGIVFSPEAARAEEPAGPPKAAPSTKQPAVPRSRKKAR